MTTASALDLSLPVEELTAFLVDTSSVSGREGPLADLIEEALLAQPHLRVDRDGDAVVARTEGQAGGAGRTVMLAGHIDTVPVADNLPSYVDGDYLYGCGTSDMKSGVAVQLRLATTLTAPAYHVTYVFYDNEEVEAERNGLRRLAANHLDWLSADLAILLEPTSGLVEAGCQGTLRVAVHATGRRAHSARSWLGSNAIHSAAEILSRLAAYRPREVEIDGCVYREGLNAVAINGGVAGNIIPDECTVVVNFRFAPDLTEAAAFDHVREVFDGFELDLVDSASAAPPGLTTPLARAFVEAVGTGPQAKYGWTDVARFAALGIPALNYGPGDPNLAHTREEHVELAKIGQCESALRRFLTTVAA